MEGRKPSRLMETIDIMDLIPSVGNVHCIIQDHALSGVRISIKYAIRLETVGAKNFCLHISLYLLIKSRDEISEDAKLKLLRSLPSAWNNISLIMRNKSDLDILSMDDLYNNLKAEEELTNLTLMAYTSQGSSSSSSSDFKGEGYHVVSLPYTGNYIPLRADLSFVRLDNAVFKSKESDSKDENVLKPKEVKKTVKPSLEKIEFVNSSHRAAASVSAARRVNNVASRPNVNNALPTTYSYFKPHSPVKRPFNQKSATKTNNFNEKVNTAKVNNVTTAGTKAVVSDIERHWNNNVNGCSRHMTGNKSYLTDYHEIDGGFVAFGGNAKGGKITGKGKIRTGKLDFKDVYFVKELKSNLFSVSQMCDKKNNVLFTDTECVVLSPDLKLLDESQVLLKVPRNNNMYSFDLNVVPVGGLTCLFAKATLDESNLWHRRPGHINFKTINKLVRGNLARGLPLKIFETDHTCVACQKGKQHKASCPKSSENKVADDAGKKSTKVPRKENEVQDPAKEGDNNDQEKYLRDQEEALRKQFSSSFTIMDPGRERAQRNEFESMFGQDKDANGNMMFTPVSAVGSTYVNLGGSIPVNATTLPNASFPIDPLMPDLEDTANLQDTGIFSGKHAIGTKWVYRNKKDERGIVVRNKARLVTPKKKELIMMRFLLLLLGLKQSAYASLMGFMVYQMDVKSDFIYETIEEEVYVYQPPGFEDPDYLDKVYKVVKALYGFHQAPRAWYETLANYLLENGFQRGKIDHTLFIKKQKGDILLVQVYVDDIIFGSTNKELYGKSASTPIDTEKPLLKDHNGEDVDVHIYSNYATASLDRKSTIGGCQFLGCRLISWQCKKQTAVATLSTEAEYVAAASCCAQVLWIQNQLLDHG
nr:ribonuclease H-like domain-containing protein [Tanacetum cinerariifolium]